MQSQFEREPVRHRVLLCLCTIAVMFFFVFNPQGLSFEYGSGNGKYADRADSFSEYIVRNTIKRNILNKQDSSFTPIVTRGYDKREYAYTPDGYTRYVSNLALQTVPATILARLLSLDNEEKLDRFFSILRLANALLLSIFIVEIFLCYCRTQQNRLEFLIPLLVGCSSGLIFFSQNLYFASCLIVLPAFYIARQLCHHRSFNKYPILFFGVAYFLRGFEFSTVFALLTAFSAALFTSGSMTRKMKAALLAFGLICLAFAAALILHVILVSADSGQSFGDTARNMLNNIQHRTQSTTGVPFPFGAQFVKVMNERWAYPAFSVTENGFALSQLGIIITMLLGVISRARRITDNEKIIYLYGFLGYASWYVFAYQHIMWHAMYDWYIFAMTMGLSFGLLFVFYTSLSADYFKALFHKCKND